MYLDFSEIFQCQCYGLCEINVSFATKTIWAMLKFNNKRKNVFHFETLMHHLPIDNYILGKGGYVFHHPLRRDNPPCFIMTRGITGSQVTLCGDWFSIALVSLCVRNITQKSYQQTAMNFYGRVHGETRNN